MPTWLWLLVQLPPEREQVCLSPECPSALCGQGCACLLHQGLPVGGGVGSRESSEGTAQAKPMYSLCFQLTAPTYPHAEKTHRRQRRPGKAGQDCNLQLKTALAQLAPLFLGLLATLVGSVNADFILWVILALFMSPLFAQSCFWYKCFF